MRIGIFGTSGLAREFADIAYAKGDSPFLIGRDEREYEALTHMGGYEMILEAHLLASEFKAEGYVIGIGDNDVRKTIAARYPDLNYANLVHPSVTFGMGQEQKIESIRGLVICAGCRLTNNIKIGDHTIINLNSTIGHDSVLGDFVNISPGVNVSGNVAIASGVLIGTGAKVNHGQPGRKLEIATGVTVGSGAVVTKSLTEAGIYVGMPARMLVK